MNSIKLIALLGLSTLTLTACGLNVRDELGLNRESPDEFAVVTRAPLEIPSHLALPPPIPGMPRPQETSAIDQAKQAVLGNDAEAKQTLSAAESVLLNRTGAAQSDPTIRATVNNETKALTDRNEPVAQKLINMSGKKHQPSATIVDAKKELERIQEDTKAGKNITGADTPTIEE